MSKLYQGITYPVIHTVEITIQIQHFAENYGTKPKCCWVSFKINPNTYS